MDKDTYIKMLDDRVWDCHRNMVDAEKKYLTLKAAYESIVNQKINYIKWVEGAENVENKD